MHANAAGISIHESKLADLLKYSNTTISDEGLNNAYLVDYIFDSDENIKPLMLQLASCGCCWGNDVEEPTAIVENIPFSKFDWNFIGANKDTSKLIYNGVEYIHFKDADFVQEVSSCARGVITVYGSIKKNTWGNKVTPQLLIRDWEITDTSNEF